MQKSTVINYDSSIVSCLYYQCNTENFQGASSGIRVDYEIDLSVGDESIMRSLNALRLKDLMIIDRPKKTWKLLLPQVI